MTVSIISVAMVALGVWALSRRFTLMVMVVAIAWGATAQGMLRVELPAPVVARLAAHEAEQEQARIRFLCERRTLVAIQKGDHDRFDQIQRSCPVKPGHNAEGDPAER